MRELDECPDCGAWSLPLVFGLPDPALVDAVRRGEVALGGCVVGVETHRCTRCGREFAGEARRVSAGPVVVGSPDEPRVALALVTELRRVAPGDGELFVREYRGLYRRLVKSDSSPWDDQGLGILPRVVDRLVTRLNRCAPDGLAFGPRDDGVTYGWWPRT